MLQTFTNELLPDDDSEVEEEEEEEESGEEQIWAERSLSGFE